MNKQKTLIFSLSAILFLAVSFIVYSWTEPTTMPSSYNSPINTSSTAQSKAGEIGASMFRDYNNSSYYIDPSGNSVIAGKIVTDNPASAVDFPNTIVTKGYVDEQIALVRSIVTGAQPLVNGAHTWNECEAAGGTVVDSDVELKQCRFELSACPSEWNQYKNFSEAPSGDCTLCYYSSCYTCVTYSLKPWGNSIFSCRLPNSTTYWTADTPCCFPTNGADMCTMARTAIGCY